MRHQKVIWMGAAVLLAVVFSGVVDLYGQAASKGRPTAVATLDVSKVLNELEELSELKAKLRRRQEDIFTEKADREAEIGLIEQDLTVLTEGTKSYKDAEDRRARKVIELDAWLKFHQARLQIDQAVYIEDIYRTIVSTVGVVAEQDGWDIVLYLDDIDAVRGQNVQQVQQQIVLRKLIYSAADLDISDRVIQMLNNEFENKTPDTDG